MTKGVDAYEEFNRDKPHPSMDTEHGKRVRRVSIPHTTKVCTIVLYV